MTKLQKIALALSTVGTGLMAAFGAGATILDVPAYSDVVNTTTTEFGGGLLTDLIPWAGALAVITIAGLALAAIVRRVLGGVSRITGGKRRGGRGRRRR